MGSVLPADALVLPCSLGSTASPIRRAGARVGHFPAPNRTSATLSPAYSRGPLLLWRPLAAAPRRRLGVVGGGTLWTNNSVPSKNGIYTVGDVMTKRKDLKVVRPTTTVDEALELLVEHRITGFPVVDDDWKLVGVVSDYDLLALDSISGSVRGDTDLFPEVDSTWKTFNEIQKLLNKTYGKVVGDLMTPAPLVVRETTNLEDAARLLLETKYRRLPVVNGDGTLVGILTRGNVVKAALQIKRETDRTRSS